MLTLDFAAAALVIFAGALLQGTGGIGFGMFVAPLLALFHPELVPGPVLLLGGLLAFFSAVREFRSVELGGVALAVAGRIPAAFVAGYAMLVLSAHALSLLFAVLILIGVGLSFAGWRVQPTGRNLFAAGFASGFMGTITSVGAPPMALIYQHADAARLRANIGAYFTGGTAASLVALASVGKFGVTDVWRGLALAVPMAAGFGVSSLIVPYVTRAATRRFVLVVSGLAAAALIALQFA
jgi:uncharacterized membrane protein YfcA